MEEMDVFKINDDDDDCMVGATPEYLMCRPVSSAVGQPSLLRSAPYGDLNLPRFWLQISGHRVFAVSGTQIWN